MRTRSQLMKELSIEEYQAIEEKAKRLLLLRLLHEVGYDTERMQRVTYTASELRDRLIAAIRRDKIEVQELKRRLEEAEESYIRNLDTLFAHLRELKGPTL